MTLTAATLRREILEPSLEARAINLGEERVFYNPSPEPDSLIEVLAAATRTLTAAGARGKRQAVYLWDYTLEARDHNRREGDKELVVCGAADGMVSHTRSLELSGPGGASPLTAKAIARALREPLRVIAEPSLGDPRAWVDAGRTVGEIFARTPSGQLFSPAVTRELGKAKAAALRDLYDRRETKGAATPAKGRGATEPRGEAHGRSDGE